MLSPHIRKESIFLSDWHGKSERNSTEDRIKTFNNFSFSFGALFTSAEVRQFHRVIFYIFFFQKEKKQSLLHAFLCACMATVLFIFFFLFYPMAATPIAHTLKINNINISTLSSNQRRNVANFVHIFQSVWNWYVRPVLCEWFNDFHFRFSCSFFNTEEEEYK